MAGNDLPVEGTITYVNTSSGSSIIDCTQLPGPIDSFGLWNYIGSGSLPFTLPLLQLQMVIIFTLNQAAHYVLKRHGLPKFTTQLLVGIILGPSLLGRFGIIKKVLFSLTSQEIIDMFAHFSFILFFFMSTVKMDLGMIKRTGRKAMVTGVACILSPLLIALLVEMQLERLWPLNKKEAFIIPFVTIQHCVSPFPVLVCLLEDLKILNSELGRFSLSAAMITDLLSVIITIMTSFSRVSRELGNTIAAIDSGAFMIYIIFNIFAIRPTMLWIIRQTPAGKPVKGMYIDAIIVVFLGSALFSHFFGQTLIFGPVILGFAIPDGPPLGLAIVNKLNCFASDVFLPLFVTTCSMRADFSLIKFDSNFVKITAVVIFLIFVVKIVACLVPALYSKMPLNDALALALLLSYKGVIQLSINTFNRDIEAITDQVFALICLHILLIAIFVPLLVKFLYDPSRQYAGYQKRNIMHCTRNAELRILACIHKPDNIGALIKLLEVSCPSRERPLAIYVLHLIELIGRTSPIFISHQMQKKTVSNRSYSENIILAFDHFEQDNPGAVSVNVFTLISPLKSLHENICILGLDKLTSIIVLPFHRKWSIDGSVVESEDNTMRTLNCNVLEVAPCSVGILIDRGHLGQSMVSSNSSYSVAMIFFGGNDDREALTFAKRMANHSKITLTVVHFVSARNEGDAYWDEYFFDSEILKDVKLNNTGNESVTYIEEVVKDGRETALIIRCMVKEYDLIIVGRRNDVETPQTSGLAEWSEFSELGVIGDLLASSDVNSRTSVFVVQQQQNI
ncbi:cation/H(+) antiporter 4-like [Corylus avellana]|uniref:cation/H(+) antiporter 4-like n=1 Tax=Corylus avellana TaxID=13451 RepID=UPI001E2277AB|nr:cation/H(+) antiporter 4-like [Corylus avellana]